MSDPARQKARYEDLVDLPEHMVGEILNGVLHASPRPSPAHARAYSALGYRLGGPFDGGIDGPGGWWIMDEPELHFRDDILVPDLAAAWFELAPDWVCEILSPSTAQIDRGVKMQIYAREGVRHLWLVDPEVRTLEAYVLGDNDLWSLLSTIANDDPVKLPPFDAISFPLDGLWA